MGKKKILFVFIAQSFLIAHISAQQAATPCPCCEEAYHQFDFWLGDWVVYSKGKMAGFNKINKIEGGCIIRENWKAVGSSLTGTSYNFYDKVEKKWKQVWVDNHGSVLELSGSYADNKMIMLSDERIEADGKRIINRIIWTDNDDGTVNQRWELSEDGGLSFDILFDGLYRKRK